MSSRKIRLGHSTHLGGFAIDLPLATLPEIVDVVPATIQDLIRRGLVHPEEPICDDPGDSTIYACPKCKAVYLPASSFEKSAEWFDRTRFGKPVERTCGSCLFKRDEEHAAL